jgi:hypothetical protein
MLLLSNLELDENENRTDYYPTLFSHSSCYITLKITGTFFILPFRFFRFQMRHCTIYNIFLILDEYTELKHRNFLRTFLQLFSK